MNSTKNYVPAMAATLNIRDLTQKQANTLGDMFCSLIQKELKQAFPEEKYLYNLSYINASIYRDRNTNTPLKNLEFIACGKPPVEVRFSTQYPKIPNEIREKIKNLLTNIKLSQAEQMEQKAQINQATNTNNDTNSLAEIPQTKPKIKP